MRNPFKKERVDEFELKTFKSNTQSHVWTESAAEAVEYGQTGFFTTVFSFFTTGVGKEFLMMKPLIDHLPLQVFLFPIAALLELAESTIALVHLANAENKNLEKSINFGTRALKSSIIITAVIIGVVATVTGAVALGAVVPYLFVTALALNTAFSIALSIYHAVKMLKASEGSALRQSHREELTKNLVRSVVGIIMVAVIATLFAVGVSTGVGLGVTAAIGIATVIGVAIYAGVMKYRAKKAAAAIKEQGYDRPEETEKDALLQEQPEPREAIRVALSGQALPKDIVEASHAVGSDRSDRLYVRDIAGLLVAAKKSGPDKMRQVFQTIIDEKIKELEGQIEKAQERAEKRPGLFNVFVPNEEPKRTEKIEALRELKEAAVDNYNGSEVAQTFEIDLIIKEHPGVFQSFMRDKGDVEVIFDAAKEFFAVDDFIPALDF